MTYQSFFDDIEINVLANLIAAFIVIVLSVLFSPLKYVILYKTYEFVLNYDSNYTTCTWDIKWNKFLLSLNVLSMRDDYMPYLHIKVNSENHEEILEELSVSDKYHKIENYNVRIKVKNIIRTSAHNPISDQQSKKYDIYIVIQRHRILK